MEQRKRLKRARTADTIYKLFEINPDNSTALGYSSNYEFTGEIYEVTYADKKLKLVEVNSNSKTGTIV